MPSFLRANNRHQTPIAALVATTIAVQLLLLVTLVVENALDFMLKLDTSLTLIPYLLAAAYALKLTMTGETYAADDEDSRTAQAADGRAPGGRLLAVPALLSGAEVPPGRLRHLRPRHPALPPRPP